MSLNGLENEEVEAAFQRALSKDCAWLLLKYASRDQIELHSEGEEIATLQKDVTEYPEQSPLFGFVRLMEKGIVVKYIPEETSRVLKARVAVHFQAVLTKFAAHDVVFPMVEPSQLNEASLEAAAFSNVLPQPPQQADEDSRSRHLGDIREDGEEGGEPRPEKHGRMLSSESVTGRGRSQSNRRLRGKGSEETLTKDSDSNRPPSSRRHLERLNTAATAPTQPARQDTSVDLERTSSFDHFNSGRRSFASTRSGYNDTFGLYQSKPKAKLGPRPSLDAGGRPHTSGSTSRTNGHRPVSTLPAGVRIGPRKLHVSGRPLGQSASKEPQLPFPPAFPSPAPSNEPVTPKRPTTSQSAIHPAPRSFATMSPAVPTMTPEKQRLMKALQLRKQQISRASQVPKLETKDLPPVPAMRVPEAVKVEERTPPKDRREEVREEVRVEVREEPRGKLCEGPSEAQLCRERTLTDATTTDKTESSPISVSASSETESTKASSISEAKGLAPLPLEKPVDIDNETASETEATPTFAGTPEAEKPEPKQESKPVSEPTLETEPEVETEKEPKQDLQPEPGPEAIVEPEKNHFQVETERDQRETPATTISLLNAATENSLRILIGEDEQAVKTRGGDAHHSSKASEPSEANSDKTETINRPVSSKAKGHRSGETYRTSAYSDRSEKYRQRLERIDPIRTSISVDSDNSQFDDSLLDELDTATVQEAKPIAVTRSPMTPLFPQATYARPGSADPRISRASSSPLESFVGLNGAGSLDPNASHPELARSISGPLDDAKKTKHGPIGLIKKVNLGSGISQRIRALEMSSSPSPQAPSPPYSAPRKGSLSSVPSRAASISQSYTSSREKSSPPAVTQNQFESPFDSARQSPRQMDQEFSARPGSVSVKAQIVRDTNPTHTSPKKTSNKSEPAAMTMHQSPIIIDHFQEGPQDNAIKTSPKQTSPATDRIDRSSAASPSERSTTSGKNRLSSSHRRRSETKSPASITSSSPSTVTEGEEKRMHKKESSRSRLLRRMSSISSASRKSLVNVISPTLKEEEPPARVTHIETIQDRGSIDLGEVNVQFPDNLLWKRRHLKIDSSGNIILSQATTDERSRGLYRRYHLSNFVLPFAPDHDRQELPHSVVLDSHDGSTLQCACETSVGQVTVLQELQDAYRNWVS